MGNLVDASKMLGEVEKIYIKTKDTVRLVNTKSSRADLYSMNGFYDEARTNAQANEAPNASDVARTPAGSISIATT